MVWFTLDSYSLLRFCGALAMLLIVYYLLFDKKALFVHCRYYLLSAIVVAGLVATLRVAVYESERVEVIALKADVIPEVSEQKEEIWGMFGGEAGAGGIEDKTDNGGISLLSETRWSDIFDYAKNTNLFLLVYIVVSGVFLFRWIFAMISIMRLKKWGSCSRQDGVLIVRNNQVVSPFSFFRMIFISRRLEGEILEVVLSHERGHIQCKHYRDTLLMELFCILFWFNPFIWFVRRELKALHEFEVDRNLLSGGLELSKYQNIIFDELMGYGPPIASGFHNSLIKKRFIMMKNTNLIRYSLLRKVMLVPALVGVVALFAFTDGEKIEEKVWLPTMPDVSAVEKPLEEALSSLDTLGIDTQRTDLKIIKQICPLSKTPVSDTLVLKEKKNIVKSTQYPYVGKDGITYHLLGEDQIVVSLEAFVRNRKIIRCIELDKNETRVTIAVPIYFDSNWVQYDEGFCIVDRKTGDTYMIRSMTRGIDLNKTLVVKGKKDRMIEFTLVFPPLKRGVKSVDIYQKYPEMAAPQPANAAEDDRWMNIKLADYEPSPDKDLYYDKEGRPKQPRKVQYLELRDDQVVVSAQPFDNETAITSIVTDKNETRVTIATPIHFDRNWVQFDKGFCIEDPRTGDIYKIKSMTRDIELNKTLVVVGKKGKMVEFTMVFPPLKKKAKVVRMYTKYKEESALSPSNGSGEWDWRNIKVAKYNTEQGQVYR